MLSHGCFLFMFANLGFQAYINHLNLVCSSKTCPHKQSIINKPEVGARNALEVGSAANVKVAGFMLTGPVSNFYAHSTNVAFEVPLA